MTLIRQGARLAACALLLAALAGCARNAARHATRHIVDIHGLQFHPDTTLAMVGDTVEWTNDDIVPHSATQDSQAWDTKLIQPHERGQIVVTARGDQPYHCMIHPTMRGRIVAHGRD